jgi:murein DD-endopeptidase MepM/ murein hydrolase activator NlpD
VYGVSTSYAHLSKAAVKEGVQVKRGDVIGYVGNTGRSTGAHLHYGVIVNDVPVNPRKYLK